MLIAVRPEKISVSAGQGPAGPNHLAGTVTSAVFSGSSTTYRVDVAGKSLAAFQQNSAARRFQPGDAVTLHWSPEHNVLVAP